MNGDAAAGGGAGLLAGGGVAVDRVIPPLNVLVSFAEGDKHVESSLRPNWRVLLDSGAFTNFNKGRDVITLDRYVGYLKDNGCRFWRYFALDRIADAQGSRFNLGHMLNAGLAPIPVFQRGQTSADLEEFKKVSDLVGIGGVANRLNSTATLKYVASVMRAARGHKVHLLGSGSPSVLHALRPYSADSSSYAQAQWAQMKLWHGTRFYLLRKEKTGLKINGRPASKQRVLLSKLCESYGLDFDGMLASSAYFTAPSAVLAGLRSYIRFQRAMRRMGVEYFIAVVASAIAPLWSAWTMEQGTTAARGNDEDMHPAA